MKRFRPGLVLDRVVDLRLSLSNRMRLSPVGEFLSEMFRLGHPLVLSWGPVRTD